LAIYVAVDYKFDQEDIFNTTDWKEINTSGSAVLPISGNSFRFRVKTEEPSGFKIDYIIAKMKLDDKRYRRGLRNANKINS
jgi:hypothetical protein